MLVFPEDHFRKIEVAEMHMLIWMSGLIIKDIIRSKDIRKGLYFVVAYVEVKMRETYLCWFFHVY